MFLDVVVAEVEDVGAGLSDGALDEVGVLDVHLALYILHINPLGIG